jgi:hypothetical protein
MLCYCKRTDGRTDGSEGTKWFCILLQRKFRILGVKLKNYPVSVCKDVLFICLVFNSLPPLSKALCLEMLVNYSCLLIKQSGKEYSTHSVSKVEGMITVLKLISSKYYRNVFHCYYYYSVSP